MELEVGVKALIKNPDGRYLFLQRSEPLPDGGGIRWNIPGGRIKPDEKLLDALVREVHEEIAMELDESPMLLAAQDIIIPSINRHIVRLTYLAKSSGEPVLGSEHSAYRWLNVKAALELNTDHYLRALLEGLQ